MSRFLRHRDLPVAELSRLITELDMPVPSFNLTINAASDIIVNAPDSEFSDRRTAHFKCYRNLIINHRSHNTSTPALNLTAGQDMWVYNEISKYNQRYQHHCRRKYQPGWQLLLSKGLYQRRWS